MSDVQTEAIIGAAIEVHRTLGPGLHEAIYEGSLCVEFNLRHIPFSQQHPIDVYYKSVFIKQQILDLLVFGEVVVELKAKSKLPPDAEAQVLSYMKAGKFNRGLLINFNVPRLVEGVQRFSL